MIDFRDIGFVGQPAFSGTSAGGSLSVSDGTHTASIQLAGNYAAADFVAASDGHGGVAIRYAQA